MLALREVSKVFEKRLDAVERLARRLGADVQEHTVHAVDRVSFEVREGEVVGLVGESGCGKSTLGRLACGLHEPSAGQVLYRGEPLDGTRRRRIQMIFQDPFASLNPRLRVGEIVGEAPRVHGLVKAGDTAAYVAGLLQRVGLDGTLARRYPHQFSGGQRARIGIARALAVKPEFMVCDESVAALDVSIQAQVLNLFTELRGALNLTYLFISHDLGVVRFISDRVVVMYLGRVVESAPAGHLFANPNHPYTIALLGEAGKVQPGKRTFVPIKGEIPSPLDPPPGCHFHPRCPFAMDKCREAAPPLREIAPGHRSACFLNDE